MSVTTATETSALNDATTHCLRRSAWHVAFHSELLTQPHALSSALSASELSPVNAATVYAASLLEAVGYPRAGDAVQCLLQAREANEVDTTLANELPQEHPRSWLDWLNEHTCAHAAQLLQAKTESASELAAILQATQQSYSEQTSTRAALQSRASCDALFARLAADYLDHTALHGSTATPAHASLSVFQYCATSPAASASSSSPATTTTTTSAERSAVARQQRLWYAARLYSAIACAVGISAPGPLCRLLVAYAHQGDQRLHAMVHQNLLLHLRASATLSHAGAGNGAEGGPELRETAPADASMQARVRLSGVIAGVLEYALYVAQVRSSMCIAALNTVTVSSTATSTSTCDGSTAAFLKVPQSAALLLVHLAEEDAFYLQTAGTTPTTTTTADGTTLAAAAPVKGGPSSPNATAASLTIVHAMQELLFTVVLGGATLDMPNRPEPTSARKPGSGIGSHVPDLTASFSSLLLTTTRGLCLSEADALVQEIFPALVQQLGLEWVWSPLLRHLSSLDKVATPAAQNHASPTSKAVKSQDQQSEPVVSATSSPSSGVRVASAVRWSSHALMDMILLCIARKSYPQRLLNILPGSYERLLQNLDLLPPTRPQNSDSDSAADTTAAARARQPNLFEMPAYYAEPAAAVVAYFQRAGVAGLRLEEVRRILTTSTSSYAMIVRLKAQAPSLAEAADGVDEDGELDNDGRLHSEAKKEEGRRGPAHAYVLSRERVRDLISRYEGEVLLAAVVVYTQLRVASQVQQLMRALAPLFMQIHLNWRTHHDGSAAAWLLQQHVSDAGSGTRAVRFSAEAALLLDKVGYEFYPLEWLPAAASSIGISSSSSSRLEANYLALPYSLCAAVGHQFGLQLRGTPLGGSGDATLRHPAGPRTAVVMPQVETASLFPESARGRQSGNEEEAVATVAAWRRAERFLNGLLHVCYLDPKTSSTELEGTLAVSSTRRVLTTNDAVASSASSRGGGFSVGGAAASSLVAASDIAAQRLRSLLHQRAVMDAMWGSMDERADAGGSAARHGGNRGMGGQQRAQKRPRSAQNAEADVAEAREQLAAMRQLLLDYGAASFDTTIEASDFALVVAQGFLPSTAGMSSAAVREQRSDVLLQRGLEWSRAAVGLSSNKARINMLLQQQQQQQVSNSSSERKARSEMDSLARAYNSATVDAAWLARSALRRVPSRILEKLRLQQAQARALTQRHEKWISRLPAVAKPMEENEEEVSKAGVAAAAEYRVDPLLREQWTQWTRVWQQLGLAELTDNSSGFGSSISSTSGAAVSADDMSCAQWLWYSPYFASEWSD